MQRVLQRRLLARNQALKGSRRQTEKQVSADKRKARQETSILARAQRSMVKEERKNRREDWMLGPLAPNRTAGKDGGSYGMLYHQHVNPPFVEPAEREDYFNFAVDDRVVVVKGRERGKIGKVNEIDEEKQTVTIRDVNMVDLKIPPFKREQGDGKVPFVAVPLPIRVQDVRLVVASLDTMTGKVKDEVVQHLRGGEPIIDPPYGSNTPKHTRYIGGTERSIPWPKAQTIEFQAEVVDTLRIHVDEESFFPSVQHLTVPEGLIDELRSKYSTTRRVHTQEYIRQKMAEDAKEQWEKRRRMVLPQQEYWEYKAKQKSTLGGPTVTAETLDLIRDTQAARRGKSGQRMDGLSA